MWLQLEWVKSEWPKSEFPQINASSMELFFEGDEDWDFHRMTWKWDWDLSYSGNKAVRIFQVTHWKMLLQGQLGWRGRSTRGRAFTRPGFFQPIRILFSRVVQHTTFNPCVSLPWHLFTTLNNSYQPRIRESWSNPPISGNFVGCVRK